MSQSLRAVRNPGVHTHTHAQHDHHDCAERPGTMRMPEDNRRHMRSRASPFYNFRSALLARAFAHPTTKSSMSAPRLVEMQLRPCAAIRGPCPRLRATCMSCTRRQARENTSREFSGIRLAADLVGPARHTTRCSGDRAAHFCFPHAARSLLLMMCAGRML